MTKEDILVRLLYLGVEIRLTSYALLDFDASLGNAVDAFACAIVSLIKSGDDWDEECAIGLHEGQKK